MTPLPTTRYEVCVSDAIPERGRMIVDVGEKTVGIFRVDGQLYAYENTCAHQGGPVCQGAIIPRVRERLDQAQATLGFAFDETQMHIVCPWHGFEYRITTGRHPAKADIALLPIHVTEQNGFVYVAL
jgi:nitrite reductase/ring-hydroxylating ferredoxin subunit